MMRDYLWLSNIFLGVITLLALAAVLTSLMRVSSINPRHTLPRVVIGASAKCLANILILFSGVDWFYGGELFRWYMLTGAVLLLASDLLQSVCFVRLAMRRQRRAK